MLSLRSSKAARVIEKDIKTHAAKMRKAGARALNKTSKQSKTFASRDLRNTLNLPAARVTQVIFTGGAKPNNLKSSLRVRRRAVPAVYYKGWKAVRTVRGHRTSTNANRTRLLKRGGGKGGVTVRFRKDKAPVHFPQGFVAVVPGGHLGLFVRKGRTNYPIKEITGPNVQSLFIKGMPVYVKRGQDILQRVYEQEIAFELKRR